ncbi:C-C chemokine receptor-like 2 isoform X3 [Moschus berezovskii]|uniref:C-C chemokine receptor-like 2 isoform X3 n=1 Tax=Moschus berezovskii TaxID=68408 RepID=UPI002444AE20|nr:C-C chemokine receptor-like 2 isoform X3 [Moschus berezovskii]
MKLYEEGLKMANYTSAPEDDYDVLIEDDLSNNEIEPCTPYDPKILSAQLVPYLYSTVFMAGLLDNILFVFILMESQKYKCFFTGLHFLPADETSWKHFLTLKMNILGFLLPLFAFVYSYVRMRATPQFRERNYDLFKLVFTVMAVFLLMWGPYNIALFLSAFNEHFSLHGCGSSYNLNKSVQITRIIAATHCCINPLLYVFLDKAFRKHLSHLCYLCSDTAPQPTEEPAQSTSGEEYHLSRN